MAESCERLFRVRRLSLGHDDHCLRAVKVPSGTIAIVKIPLPHCAFFRLPKSWAGWTGPEAARLLGPLQEIASQPAHTGRSTQWPPPSLPLTLTPPSPSPCPPGLPPSTWMGYGTAAAPNKWWVAPPLHAESSRACHLLTPPLGARCQPFSRAGGKQAPPFPLFSQAGRTSNLTTTTTPPRPFREPRPKEETHQL